MNGIPEADKTLATRLPFSVHGAVTLPDVRVENYSLVFTEKGKFIGDKVNKSAFAKTLDALRKRKAKNGGKDPFGDLPSAEIRKSHLAETLAEGDPDASEIVNAALDIFAGNLFDVLQRYRKTDEWRRVERIAIGGGFSDDRIGRIAVARAQARLHDEKIKCELKPIKHDPDEAGLIGAAYLAPPWVFSGFDAIIGVDIGGTNIRCGAVRFKLTRHYMLSKAKVIHSAVWRHADDGPNRTQAIEQLVGMIEKIIRKCREDDVRLAPFIGVGCPGRIRPDGTIDRGAQNLPGKWEGDNFNLPALLRDKVAILKKHETVVVMHNDAVVQGLSQIPAMRDVAHWAILTIGTGLGNAKFTSRGQSS